MREKKLVLYNFTDLNLKYENVKIIYTPKLLSVPERSYQNFDAILLKK